MCSEGLLDFSGRASFLEEGLKEAEELLVFDLIQIPVVVKDGEEQLDDYLVVGAIEHEEIVVFVKEDHLVERVFALHLVPVGS